MDYILFNGKMVAAGDFNPAGHWLKPHFSLKEKMWFANGQIPFFPDHIRNIEEILALAGKTWPAEIPPQKELVRLSLRLINKNKAFNYSISVDYARGGSYRFCIFLSYKR